MSGDGTPQNPPGHAKPKPKVKGAEGHAPDAAGAVACPPVQNRFDLGPVYDLSDARLGLVHEVAGESIKKSGEVLGDITSHSKPVSGAVELLVDAPAIVDAARSGKTDKIGEVAFGTAGSLTFGALPTAEAIQESLPWLPGVAFVGGYVAEDLCGKVGSSAVTAVFNKDPKERHEAVEDLKKKGHEYVASAGAPVNATGAVVSSVGKLFEDMGKLATKASKGIGFDFEPVDIKYRALYEERSKGSALLTKEEQTYMAKYEKGPRPAELERQYKEALKRAQEVTNVPLNVAGSGLDYAGSKIGDAGKWLKALGHELNANIASSLMPIDFKFIELAKRDPKYLTQQDKDFMGRYEGSPNFKALKGKLAGQETPAVEPTDKQIDAQLTSELKQLQASGLGGLLGKGDAQDQLAHLKAAFKEHGVEVTSLDKNHDGRISVQEITNVLLAQNKAANTKSNGRNG